MVDAPVSVNIPPELTRPIQYPSCSYRTNIQLAECIQSTRGALDEVNKNLEAVAMIVASAIAIANP